MYTSELLPLLEKGVSALNTASEEWLHRCVSSTPKEIPQTFEEAAISVLQCVILLRNRRLARTTQSVEQQRNGKERKRLEEDEEIQFKNNMLERIASLGFVGTPCLQQYATTLISNIVCVDTYWIPFAIPVVLKALQSDNCHVVLTTLTRGVLPVLKYSLKQLLELQQTTHRELPYYQEEFPISGGFPSLIESIEGIWLWITEISILLTGQRQLYSKLSEIIEIESSCTPQVGALQLGNPKLQLVVYRFCLKCIIEMSQVLGKYIIDHGNHRLQFELDQLLCIIAHLLLKPVLPKSPIPFLLTLESTVDLLTSFQTRSLYLPIVLPVVAVIASSQVLRCQHDQSKQTHHSISLTEISPLMLSLITDENGARTLSSKLICCGPHAARLHEFVTLQLLRLLHNSKDDIPFQSILFEFLSYRLCKQKVKFGSLNILDLHHIADEYNSLGMFTKSSVTHDLKLEDFSLITVQSDPEVNSGQLVPSNDGTGVRIKYENKQKLDAVSWLSTTHSHREVIDIILKNFSTSHLPQSLNDNDAHQWGSQNRESSDSIMNKLFSVTPGDQKSTLDRLWTTSVVVKLPSVSSSITRTSSAEPQDQQLIQKVAETIQEICSQYENQKEHFAEVENNKELELTQKPIKKRRTEEQLKITVTPTSLTSLLEHKHLIQLVLLAQIFNANSHCSVPLTAQNTDQESDVSFRSTLESKMFEQIKFQILQKIIFDSSNLDAKLQNDALRALLTKIWPRNEVGEESLFIEVWNRQMDSTLELLFSKYSFCFRNEYRRQKQKQKSFSISTKLRRCILHGYSIASGPLGFYNVVPYTQLSCSQDVDHDINNLDENTNHNIEESITIGNGNQSNQDPFGPDTELPINLKSSSVIPSYDTCYNLCMEYSNDTTTTTPMSSTISVNQSERLSRLLQHKSFARILLRLFSDVPYVPYSAFLTIWKWMKGLGPPLSSGSSVERKLGLAVLSYLLKSTRKATEAKRTAYAVLLHLCFDVDSTLRQEALGFVHRKILYNPENLGEMVQKESIRYTDTIGISENQHLIIEDNWNNSLACSSWIESCTSLVLKSLITEVDPSYQVDYQDEHPVVIALSKQIVSRQREIFSRLSGLPLSEYLRHKVLASGLLFCVCSSRNASLLKTLIEVYEAVQTQPQTETTIITATHLNSLFVDALQWTSASAIPDLLYLSPICSSSSHSLALGIIDRLITLILSPENRSFLPSVISEGVSAYKRLNSFDFIVSLLPCLNRHDILHYFSLIIDTGDKLLITKTIKSLRTIPNIVEKVDLAKVQPGTTNVWSGESLLSFLFDLGEYSISTVSKEVVSSQPVEPETGLPVARPQVQFKRVVEALDVCFDIAKSNPEVVSADAFASFLTRIVDDFTSTETHLPNEPPKRLPRLFGRLLLLVAVHITSLTSFLISTILPSLFQHSIEIESLLGSSMTIWCDTIAWRGISTCYSRLWSSVVDSNLKEILLSLLFGLPRHVFELLFQDLQRECPSARNDLVSYVLQSQTVMFISCLWCQVTRPPIPSYIVSVLGL